MHRSIVNMATQRSLFPSTTVGSQVATPVPSVTLISNYGNYGNRMVTLQVLPSSRVNRGALSASNNVTRPSMCSSPAPLSIEVWLLVYLYCCRSILIK